MLKSTIRIILLLFLTVGIGIISFIYGTNKGYKIGVMEATQYIEINKSLYELEKQTSQMYFYKALNKKEFEKFSSEKLEHYLDMYQISENHKLNNRSFLDNAILKKTSTPILLMIVAPETLKDNIRNHIKYYYSKDEIENNERLKRILKE